jgi:hypothetical protein
MFCIDTRVKPSKKKEPKTRTSEKESSIRCCWRLPAVRSAGYVRPTRPGASLCWTSATRLINRSIDRATAGIARAQNQPSPSHAAENQTKTSGSGRGHHKKAETLCSSRAERLLARLWPSASAASSSLLSVEGADPRACCWWQAWGRFDLPPLALLLDGDRDWSVASIGWIVRMATGAGVSLPRPSRPFLLPPPSLAATTARPLYLTPQLDLFDAAGARTASVCGLSPPPDIDRSIEWSVCGGDFRARL